MAQSAPPFFRLRNDAGTRDGGRFFERSTEGEIAVLGAVVTCDPPHALSYTWRPGSTAEPTLVEIRFSEDSGGTRIIIRHSEAEAALGQAWTEKAILGLWG